MRLNQITTACMLVLASTSTVAVEWDPWLKPGFTSREQNHRPGNNSINADSFFLEGRIGLSDQYDNQWSWFVDARAQVFSEDASLTDENELEVSINRDDNYYAQLREAWVRYAGLTHFPNEYVTLGLQRTREFSGLWWDAEIESISWFGNTTQLDWLLVAGEELDTYRTNADLRQQNEDTFRLFGEVKWDWTAYHALEFKYASADQKRDAGSTVRPDLAIGNNFDLQWYSIGLSSEWFEKRYQSQWAYKLEWMTVQGDTDVINANQLSVRQDIDADAIDAGIRYDFNDRDLSIGISYAAGSGGYSQGESNNFVQTGLHTNRARFYGNNQYMYRFNEALRADLTNMKQTSVFVSWSPASYLQSVIMLARYEKDDASQPIFVSGRPVASVTGESAVGTSLDVNLSYYPQNQAEWLNMNLMRLRVGTFSPDDGLVDQTSDYRVVLEAQFRY